MSRIGLVSALLLCSSLSAKAVVVAITPSGDLRAAIGALSPGDELVLGGGTYNMSSRFAITANGTITQPIVIRAKTGESPLIQMNTSAQNIVEVQGSSHLVLRGLRFSGGSHGIRLMSSSFVTIEDCELFETGDVALSANSGGTYDGLIIRRNHIHNTNGTGEGMYLGCNSNACRVINSTIESNYIHHTNGATVEQGDGIELKEGSANNVIRNNVIHDTNYPGIITYSTAGNGAPNILEGNVIWNTNDSAIQSAADAIIRNNIVIGSISLQPHQAGSPSNHTVVHNTVIGDSIYVRNATGTVIVANNAVYAQSGAAINVIGGNTTLITVAGNAGTGGVSGVSGGFTAGTLTGDFVNAHFGVPPIDLFPKQGSALIGAGSANYVPAMDFNETARGGAADVGAYKYATGGNPGWTIAPGFKSSGSAARPNPPTNLTVQ